MKIYKIRVTREVLETVNATRRADVYGEVLTFGREPVYVRAAELPPQLADDRYLHIETVDSAPSVVVVIDLKSERVQEPTVASDEELDLKSERVQEPTAEAFPGDETDLKSERVQEPTAETSPGPETDLKSERVQEPTAAAAPAYAAPSRRKRG
jgi:hypothetical protein